MTLGVFSKNRFRVTICDQQSLSPLLTIPKQTDGYLANVYHDYQQKPKTANTAAFSRPSTLTNTAARLSSLK